MGDPTVPTFPVIAEWLFRLVPIAISAAGFVFAVIARRDTRKKLTVHWQSTLVASTATRTGDPSVVIGIHNTGKRSISLVQDSYYI
jgi:hypothetical protein